MITDTTFPVQSFKLVALCTRLSDNQPIVQADVATAKYSIWNAESKEPLATNVSLTISSVFFNTLQTDSRFRSGYNFAWIPPLLPPENKTYYYRVQLELQDGTKLPIVYQRKTQYIGAP